MTENEKKWLELYSSDRVECQQVKLMRRRQLSDFNKAETEPEYPYYFDWSEAERVVTFIEGYCRHSIGALAGKPFKLSLWQREILQILFGWKRKNTGLRRFRKAFIFVPRKNGKSTLISAIGLYLLVADGEVGAEIYCAATKREQAKIVFSETARMVRQNSVLSKYVRCKVARIECIGNGAVMLPLGQDSERQDGLNVHAGLIDEYHAHKTDRMLEVLNTGTGQRRQPLILIITTAGFLPDGPCALEQNYAEKILSGALDNDQYFAFIAKPDSIEAPDSEEEWLKANPELGLSMSLEKFREDWHEAKALPSKRASFLVKRLNIWERFGAASWVPVGRWRDCEQLIDWKKLEGKQAFLGLDIGQTKDLTSLSMVIKDNGKYYNRVWSWIPEDTLSQRIEEEGTDYRPWIEDGWIETTPGEIIDLEQVLDKIIELSKIYKIVEVAADPYRAATTLKELDDEKITTMKHSQRIQAMTHPIETLEKMIMNKTLFTDSNPTMRWMISNCVVKHDRVNNCALEKMKRTAHIDGVIATAMALSRCVLTTNKKFKSVGITTF